jgi:hypothetical protein
MKPVSDGGGCEKRENPSGQPPTLASYEGTEGTEFTEFVFSTWIFRMYRIGEMAGKWNGQGSRRHGWYSPAQDHLAWIYPGYPVHRCSKYFFVFRCFSN